MQRLLLGSSLIGAALCLPGCANVSVKKVSVEDRVAGADDKVKGFRYYLTRPYILVKQQVDLGAEVVAVKPKVLQKEVGSYKKGTVIFVSAAPYPATGKYRYFGPGGEEIADATALKDKDALGDKPQGRAADPAAGDGVALANLAPMQPGTGSPGVAVKPPGNPGTSAPAPAGSTPTFADLDFVVVNLPDFEEQYAIKNCNFAAKTVYQYSFADGSKLSAAGGAYDATDVPVKLLNTVQNLIGAAAAIRSAATKNSLTGDTTGGKAKLTLDKDDTSVVYLVIQQHIEPGLYRLQKSWERVAAQAEPGMAPDRCLGVISELGFSVCASTRILTAIELDAEFNAR
jgi:hypothetical protein